MSRWHHWNFIFRHWQSIQGYMPFKYILQVTQPFYRHEDFSIFLLTALVAIGIEKSMAKYLLTESDNTQGIGKFCVVLYLWFIDRKQI